jgi:hypothetical protein
LPRFLQAGEPRGRCRRSAPLDHAAGIDDHGVDQLGSVQETQATFARERAQIGVVEDLTDRPATSVLASDVRDVAVSSGNVYEKSHETTIATTHWRRVSAGQRIVRRMPRYAVLPSDATDRRPARRKAPGPAGAFAVPYASVLPLRIQEAVQEGARVRRASRW